MQYCPNRTCPERQQTGQAATYDDAAERCRLCEALLVDGTLVPVDPKPPTENDSMVPVVRITDAALVPVIESLMIGEDIPYFVHGANAQGLFGVGSLGAGFNIIAGAPILYVHRERRDEALEVLSGHPDVPFEDPEV